MLPHVRSGWAGGTYDLRKQRRPEGDRDCDSLAAAWDTRHLRFATDAAGVALPFWNVDIDAITMYERAFSI